MPSATSSGPGFVEALRTLADNALAAVESRVQLIALEVQEEKLRLVRTFIWISAVVFTALFALAFGSIAVAVYFWEQARVVVFVSLALGYGLVFLLLVLGFRRFTARQPTLFSATLEELARDRACIRTQT